MSWYLLPCAGSLSDLLTSFLFFFLFFLFLFIPVFLSLCVCLCIFLFSSFSHSRITRFECENKKRLALGQWTWNRTANRMTWNQMFKDTSEMQDAQQMQAQILIDSLVIQDRRKIWCKMHCKYKHKFSASQRQDPTLPRSCLLLSHTIALSSSE